VVAGTRGAECDKDSSAIQLEDCLDKMLEKEELEAENTWYCNRTTALNEYSQPGCCLCIRMWALTDG
jgi:hypothetical protein